MIVELSWWKSVGILDVGTKLFCIEIFISYVLLKDYFPYDFLMVLIINIYNTYCNMVLEVYFVITSFMLCLETFL